METNDWQRVEELFHAALELPAAEQASFLTAACQDDGALRDEVTSLLRSFAGKQEFLEAPAFNDGLKLLAAETTLTGQRIGAYRIERLLGRGGMGEVYLAEDTRLQRRVALKFLARRLAADPWARRRLLKEAQAVAQLDHPNICAVYGLEEAEGHSFIVMQYVEGLTLAELIGEQERPVSKTGTLSLNGLASHAPHLSEKQENLAQGASAHLTNAQQMDAERVLALARQIVSALAAAHAHGIIHRDIKPQNLMVTGGSQLKVLDFGLAQAVQGQPNARVAEAPSQPSQKGLIAGTVAYMSPEQLRAERLDYRSDIFSVGVVLYEMLAGEHPFLRTNDAETIAAVLHAPPPPLPRRLNGRVLPLASIIYKCLVKEKEQRYQSVNELILDLENLSMRHPPARVLPRLHPVAAVAALTLCMAAVLWAYFHFTAVPLLAVFPFINEKDDPQVEQLIAGLPEGLADQIARLSKLKVKAPVSFNKAMAQTQEKALQAGRKLGAATLLLGQARASGNAVQLQIQLVSADTGTRLWEKSYELQPTDGREWQSLLVAEITQRMGLQLSGEEERRLTTTPSAAFQEYWRGRYYWHRRTAGNIEKALEHFHRAIALDPAYAPAYTGLADSYVLLPSVAYGRMRTVEAMDRARAEARKALTLDSQLPEAHTSLGIIKLKHEWDWTGAKEEFQRAINLKFDDPTPHYWYSQVLMITGQSAAGVAESETARRLDPLSPTVNLNHCRALYWARQFDTAARCVSEMMSQDPEDVGARYMLSFIHLAQGRTTEALELLEPLYRNPKYLRLAVAGLGHTYGKLGRVEEAEAVRQCMQQLAQSYLPPVEFAVWELGQGHRKQALAWLEKALEERFATLPFLQVDPLFDSLHDEPRFDDLLRQLNLPPVL